MKPLPSFEIYIKSKTVRKVKADLGRAHSLVVESERKIKSLSERLDKIGVRDENANDYVEFCYDILMLLIRAKMYIEGYSASGNGAHEAEIAYMRTIGFNEKEVNFADELRYFRNGMLYYGKLLNKEYADKVIVFCKALYPRLKKMASKN